MTPLSVFSVSLMSDNMLLLASVLIFAAIIISKAGSRLGTPSLLLFLLLGMVAGPDILGLRFDDYELAESIGHFAMTVILFTAGLETSLEETRPVFKQGTMLSTLGLLITVALTGIFIWLVARDLQISILGCILLASVVSSTDSASVFSVLREKKLHLRENLGPMLELESGSNDPVAYMLTIVLVKTIISDGWNLSGGWHAVLTGIGLLALQIVVGLAVGLAIGHAGRWILKRVKLGGFALTSILILSLGLFSSGLAAALNGNGLLAPYVTAIILGNKANVRQDKEVINFFDGITWLMQLIMFLILGLLARPSHMLPVLLPAVLIGVFMIAVARPVGVFTSLLPFRGLSIRAKAFVSWVGLKGAGPILIALYPVVAGVEGATNIFNIVFLITLFSLLVQGGSLGKVAKFLHLSYQEDPKAETFGMDIPEEMGMLRDHIVSEEDLAGGSTLRDMKLPHGIRVMMVNRGGRFLVPHGSMKLETGDRLVIIIGESDD